ncbi:MAG: ABC transporter permease [Patescibacteria group bacterium]|nr:ABC transporter permease [Patescibacteria group bacterium]
MFILKGAFHDFSRNKLRTFLTSLGIMIGVLSVILLIAIGLGLRKYIENQFQSLGTDFLYVVPGGTTSGRDSNIRFDERDLQRLRRIEGVEAVLPLAQTVTVVEFGGKSYKGFSIVQTSDEYLSARNITVEYGKGFTRQDLEKHAKVAVIGARVAEEVFGAPVNAVGQTITVQKQRLTVVGVAEQIGGGGLGGPPFDSFIYIPYKTGFAFANPERKFQGFNIKVTNSEQLSVTRRRVRSELEKRYDPEEVDVLEQTDILNTINSIFGALNIVLVAIAAISLIVGGIGIMNIMYVTVSERIREIGIRRALGARKFDILAQFLIESTILSLLGGVLGILLAFLITLGIQPFFPAYIDAISVVVALGVSSAIGIIFGVFPAKKAADLSPMEAIRYE